MFKRFMIASTLLLSAWTLGVTSSAAAEAKTYQFFVYSNPSAGKEAEYNDWYDHQHIQDVVSVPGFVSAQRAVLSDKQLLDRNDIPKLPKYLVVYTIKTDDLKAVMAEVSARLRDGRTVLSSTYDRSTSVSYTYQLHQKPLEVPLRSPAGAKTGASETYWHIVYTVFTEGREDDFNRWYDTQHAADMLKTPGIVSSQRAVLADPGRGTPPSKYIAVFTIKTADPDALITAFRTGQKDRIRSDAMNSKATAGYTYRLIGPQVSGDAVRKARAAS